jgi:hypothetical protein
MKTNEIFQQDNKDLGFDIVDDTVFFMRNDPMFYRREYFPAITKIADMHRAGKKYNPSKILSPCIEKAIVEYCRKYNIARNPEEIFTENDRQSIMQMIHSEELTQIKKGDYL